jgi:hypothetical protein
MANKATEKAVSKVIIEYTDGTRSVLDSYAAVGFSENTWHGVMLSPASTDDKIKMNNMMVELSNALLKSIKENQ